MKTPCFHHHSILTLFTSQLDTKYRVVMKTPCLHHNLILTIEFPFTNFFKFFFKFLKINLNNPKQVSSWPPGFYFIFKFKIKLKNFKILNRNSILSIELWWKQGVFITTRYLISSSGSNYDENTLFSSQFDTYYRIQV